MAPTFGDVLKAGAAGDAGVDEAIRDADGAVSWRAFETRTPALAHRPDLSPRRQYLSGRGGRRLIEHPVVSDAVGRRVAV